MNKESIDCTKVDESPSLYDTQTKPGDFHWSEEYLGMRYIYVHLPGQDRWDPIKVHRGPALGERVWGWDGNEDKPTLTPSIDLRERWHGHLTAGRLVSCP